MLRRTALDPSRAQLRRPARARFGAGLSGACVLALSSAPALAEGPEAHADYPPVYEELLLGFEDQAVDTGWIPQNSPVQLRLFAAAANSIAIELPGLAHYDWRTEELRFEGDTEAGLFEYDVGLQLEASVKVDVNLAQWESDILGPFDWAVQAVEMFTPYLLEGNPDRPAMLSDKTGAVDLVSIPLVPDIVILSGNLDIALFVDIEASLSCNRIEVIGGDGQTTPFVQEGETLWVEPGEGPDEIVFGATAYCQLQTQPTLIIYPHLVVTVLFDEYDIAGIEIPVALPVIDDEIQFEMLDLVFPYWEQPEPEPGDGDGDPAGGEGEDSGDADEGGEIGGDEGGETGESGETGAGPGAGLGEDGCNCSAAGDPPRGLLASGLALLALVGWRRRRGLAPEPTPGSSAE